MALDPRSRNGPFLRQWLTQPAGPRPFPLTGGALVDPGVRASPQELHCNPPKFGDHCNTSQETVSTGRCRGFPPGPHNATPRCRAPDLSCSLPVERPGAPCAPRTGPAAFSLGRYLPLSADRPLHFRSRVRSRRRSDASAARALGSGLCWSPAPRRPVVRAAARGLADSSDRKYQICSRLGRASC